MKVLFLTFIPSPYRLSFFEELSKKCELTVLFERGQSKYRDGNWNDHAFKGYNGFIMKGVTFHLQDRLCFSCIKYLTDSSFDVIILSNPFSPTGVLSAIVLNTLGIRYIVECDGAFCSNKNDWKLLIKRFVIKYADICMSTAKNADDYFKQAGAIESNIFRYPFTSISKSDIIPSPLSDDEKKTIRKKIGMVKGLVAVTVGRFVPTKGFDLLLRVAKRHPNISFYFIGGTPCSEYIHIINEFHLTNVFFADFLPREKLFLWYQAANLFILPTRYDSWGLVINEAMACGLPVISTNMCNAANELIKDGENGYIVQVDDEEMLSASIDKIIDGQPILMGAHSLEIIREYTFEKMAQAHIEALLEFSSKKDSCR